MIKIDIEKLLVKIILTVLIAAIIIISFYPDASPKMALSHQAGPEPSKTYTPFLAASLSILSLATSMSSAFLEKSWIVASESAY